MKARMLLAFGSLPLILVLLGTLANGTLTVPQGPQATSTPDPRWENIAIGVTYQEFTLPGPNNVFVTRMDRHQPNLILESSIAEGSLMTGKETVLEMAERYDDAINFWGQTYITPTWGTRSEVIAAVNGFYYDIPTGEPLNGMVQSGWYAKRFDDLGGGSGFAYKMDRSIFIGDCIYHRAEKQLITYASGARQQFQGVNIARDANELIVYTSQYDSRTPTGNTGIEVVVEMSRPALLLPEPHTATGIVREIRDSQGATPLYFDSIVLSAHGSAAATLRANVRVGDMVGISQQITSLQPDCVLPAAWDWTKTYTAIGDAYYYLKNKTIVHYEDSGALARHPRTALAYNDDYIFLIVVDGRDSLHSFGMTIDELAEFTLNTLNADWGAALDGGGSSTLVVNGEVKNNTHCNNTRCYYTLLPLVVNGSNPATRPASDEGYLPPPLGVPAGFPMPGQDARAVANGLMIVAVQPPQFSKAFTVNATVLAQTSGAEVRLGPGSNYEVLATVPAGAEGKIASTTMAFNGVLAKGAFWWKVNWGSVSGWVQETALRKP